MWIWIFFKYLPLYSTVKKIAYFSTMVLFKGRIIGIQIIFPAAGHNISLVFKICHRSKFSYFQHKAHNMDGSKGIQVFFNAGGYFLSVYFQNMSLGPKKRAETCQKLWS